MPHSIRIWDLPTRLFHWSLALCVIGLLITSQIGGSAMNWHFRLGYAVLSLLLFRIVWGFVGGHWSRFGSFIFSPATLLLYLRGRADLRLMLGHNPLGALSVFAMLLFLLLQVGTGLISDDEIATSGPLSRFVSATLVSQATSYHKHIGKLVLLGLVFLHIMAIVFYLWRRRENLILPMLHGDKQVERIAPASHDDHRSRVLAGLVFVLCVLLVIGMLWLAT